VVREEQGLGVNIGRFQIAVLVSPKSRIGGLPLGGVKKLGPRAKGAVHSERHRGFLQSGERHRNPSTVSQAARETATKEKEKGLTSEPPLRWQGGLWEREKKGTKIAMLEREGGNRKL